MIRVSKASGPRFVEGGGGEGGNKRVMDVKIERASAVTYSLFSSLAKLMADLKVEAGMRAGVKLFCGLLVPGPSYARAICTTSI
jgi:hypothetical protein